MASELKIARAFFFDSHWPISSSESSVRPMKKLLIRAGRRPAAVAGALAASLAMSWPGPVQRKYAAWGRSMRTRRSPSLRPDRGRWLPIRRPPSGPERQALDEPPRQARVGHRRLDGRNVVGGPVPRADAGAGVDDEVAGGDDPVPRLADAAGGDECAAVIQGERRALGRGDLLDLPVVLGPDHRQVGMAVKAERCREDSQVRPGDRQRDDVLPGRVARAAVGEAEVAL